MDTVESVKEETKTPQDTRNYWLGQLNLADKDVKEWEDLCDRIVKKYRAESANASIREFDVSTRGNYNILWSNVQVLAPSLYARTPKPDIERRFKDNDRTSSLASEVLERSVEIQLEKSDFDETMTRSVLDYLLNARGVSRVYYEPIFGQEVDPMTGEVIEVKTSESVKSKHVFYQDFRHSAARKWSDVTWVSFKTYESRDKLIEMFGEEIGKEIPLDYSTSGVSNRDRESSDVTKKAIIYEIWDKTTKTVRWISKGYDGIIKSIDDPLSLSNFFPCGAPLYATISTESLKPVPDYVLYQTHAVTLDVIQQRKGGLLDCIRANGVYNAAYGTDFSNLLKLGDGKLSPIHNYKDLSGAGGLAGIMEFAPIEKFIQVLGVLDQAAEIEKQKIYEITGISDVIRGSSDPRETAKAQQLKGQFGTLRLSTRQSAVQEFAKEQIAMMAEIIAEHFDPDFIREMSGYDIMPGVTVDDPTEWDEIVRILRDDLHRCYRIDIETDSTIATDTQSYKESWSEYLGSVSGFLQQITPIIESTPELVPYYKEALLRTSRAYKAGRGLEDSLASSFDALVERLSQPPPEPPPDPKIVVAQMEMDMRSQEMAAGGEKAQLQADVKMEQITRKYETDLAAVRASFEQVQKDFQSTILKIQAQMAQSKAEQTQSLLEAYVSQDSGTKESSSESQPAPVVQPINIVVDAKQPVAKQALIQRDPNTGLMTGATVVDAGV